MIDIVDWTSALSPRRYAIARKELTGFSFERRVKCDPVAPSVHTPAILVNLIEVGELTLVKASASRPSKEDPIMTKGIFMALIATLQSLSAIDIAQAGPRRDDDTNRYTNKSAGG